MKQSNSKLMYNYSKLRRGARIGYILEKFEKWGKWCLYNTMYSSNMINWNERFHKKINCLKDIIKCDPKSVFGRFGPIKLHWDFTWQIYSHLKRFIRLLHFSSMLKWLSIFTLEYYVICMFAYSCTLLHTFCNFQNI